MRREMIELRRTQNKKSDVECKGFSFLYFVSENWRQIQESGVDFCGASRDLAHSKRGEF